MKQFILNFFERRPETGYVVAATTTSTGFWALLERATSLIAFISVSVGLLVGIVTLQIQINTKRAQDKEKKS